MQPGSIDNAGPGSFADAFFFSVQTMATIGYGVMSPATRYANLLVTIESLLGMASFAVAAGLIFARFSRPTARVLFSRVAVVTPFNGVPTLMFRCANERRNQIFEAQVHVDFAREETSAEGWESAPLLRARARARSQSAVQPELDRDASDRRAEPTLRHRPRPPRRDRRPRSW